LCWGRVFRGGTTCRANLGPKEFPALPANVAAGGGGNGRAFPPKAGWGWGEGWGDSGGWTNRGPGPPLPRGAPVVRGGTVTGGEPTPLTFPPPRSSFRVGRDFGGREDSGRRASNGGGGNVGSCPTVPGGGVGNPPRPREWGRRIGVDFPLPRVPGWGCWGEGGGLEAGAQMSMVANHATHKGAPGGPAFRGGTVLFGGSIFWVGGGGGGPPEQFFWGAGFMEGPTQFFPQAKSGPPGGRRSETAGCGAKNLGRGGNGGGDFPTGVGPGRFSAPPRLPKGGASLGGGP